MQKAGGALTFDTKIPDLKKREIVESTYSDTGSGTDPWGVVYDDTRDAIGTLKGYCVDISGGTGRNSMELLKNPGITRLLVTDLDPRPLEILKRNIPKKYESKLVTQGNVNLLEKLPYEDETFGGLLAAGVLHFFEEPDLTRICTEFDRVVKPGGGVVIELETDIDRRTLDGTPMSYLLGGSPGDLKIYSSERAEELIPELFERYSIVANTTHFNGVLRKESTDPRVPPYILDCNTIVFNMKKPGM